MTLRDRELIIRLILDDLCESRQRILSTLTETEINEVLIIVKEKRSSLKTTERKDFWASDKTR